MSEEKIYLVHWQGPFNWDEIEKGGHIQDGHVLYQIYGTHPVYGRDVLLYIGTSHRMEDRLKEHDSEWIGSLAQGKTSVHLGSAAPFTSWQAWEKAGDVLSGVDEDIAKTIEKLLIYCHQPASNSASVSSLGKAADTRIFNTGRFGQLMPEVSYLYQGYTTLLEVKP